ncbi:hypothetical protein KM176_24235 [Pseudooceanicola sp. CBS1P-1]|uniref:Uncharacterized protein n=1 Tax=Pseudooceanicola albus TaxID=2692189 RepID=A0A6L7GEI8_9RHOB|nr:MULTISPECIES: hypothetical protein [Pseudooceanicola]MBT9386971.1 hypothetical protein [Pseudooceanicola endophyticus]MXN21163.1 hypothetical protein [Pseudooceanicola albus]
MTMKALSSICILALISSPCIGAEYGEKTATSTFEIGDTLKVRTMCSAAKDDGMSDTAVTIATTVSAALPGYVQALLLKGLEQALIVSPGEGYCLVVATAPGAIIPSGDISAGSIFTSAVKDGKITATETDSHACKFLNRTGVCWEEVESGNAELDGVVGCFEAEQDGKMFSVVTGREDILDALSISDTGPSAKSCSERGLGLRD